MLWNEYLLDRVKKKNLSWQKLADRLGITYHELFCGLYQGWLLNIHVEKLAKILKANLTPYKARLSAKKNSPMELYMLNRYQRQKAITSVREEIYKANSKRATAFERMFIQKERK